MNRQAPKEILTAVVFLGHEHDETSETCTKRKTLEEIDVRALQLTKFAEMTFHELHEGVQSIVHSDMYLL